MFFFNYFKAHRLTDMEEVVKAFSNKTIDVNVFGISYKNYLNNIKNTYSEYRRISNDKKAFNIKEILIDTNKKRSISFLSVDGVYYIYTQYADSLSQEQFKNYQVHEALVATGKSFPIVYITENSILQKINFSGGYEKNLRKLASVTEILVNNIIDLQHIVKNLVSQNRVILDHKDEKLLLENYEETINKAADMLEESSSNLLKEWFKKGLSSRCNVYLRGYCNEGSNWNMFFVDKSGCNLSFIDNSLLYEGNVIDEIAKLCFYLMLEKRDVDVMLSNLDEKISGSISNVMRIIRFKDSKKFLVKNLKSEDILGHIIINGCYLIAKQIIECGLNSEKVKNNFDIKQARNVCDIKTLIKSAFGEEIHPENLLRAKKISCNKFVEIMIKYIELITLAI